MVPWLNLPALGGSLLAAVALGVHLGESAIGLIDPVHFQGPALHPRDRGAAIDPNAVRPREPLYAELYGWGEGAAARLADCGGCEALAARDAYAYSAVVPYFGVSTEPPPASEPRRSGPPEPEPVEEREARSARIERYARYPVGADERRTVPDYAADDVYLDAEQGEAAKEGVESLSRY